MRLNKLLSHAGVASRRLADELIAQGRVEINGKVVTELGTKVDDASDDVRVDGRRLQTNVERRYLLMNKPRGVVSSRSDPHRRLTVIDLLAKAGVRGYFYPVGRLDYESEGLILLTNDGAFAERVAHPRYEMERTYEAVVEGVPDGRDIARLEHGVLIEGRKTLPAKVHVVRTTESAAGAQAILEITLREGRNRQVRHMCDAIGHPVSRLRRIRIGRITDRHLPLGKIRDLTPAEVKSLMAGEAAPPPRRTLRAPRPLQAERSPSPDRARPPKRERGDARPARRGRS